MRFGRRDFLLLEEIRLGYNTVERSPENGYVIPVNRVSLQRVTYKCQTIVFHFCQHVAGDDRIL